MSATALRALLVADAPLTALVGTRIRANRAEQSDTRPFVVFTRVDTQNEFGLDGSRLASKQVFEVQAWADTRASADAVTAAIETVLIADDRAFVGPVDGYDADLDLEASSLTVDWWD
jgi:hypothetical protein